ncbi:UbiX family flavin prenyltransferase [Nocardioides hungaricus]
MTRAEPTRRLVVAMTGASGAAYGVRILQILRDLPEVETHLVLSRGCRSTLHYETGRTAREVSELADVVHADHDLGASIASGSFRTDGMIVAPCSVKTLSAVANCYSSTLIARAADVTLKEQRPLVLMVRETPLHRGHVHLMDLAMTSGAVIFPPVPALYARPASIEDLVDHSAKRALDQVGLHLDSLRRWEGDELSTRSPRPPADPS